ncbi:MAG TPA: peptidyl-prolyl cis-trans isomerase [bacterium]|nr:peptidyl-prolyl cis-trans isomerase [bacterium]
MMKGVFFPTAVIVLLIANLCLLILSIPNSTPKVASEQLRQLAVVLEQQELYQAAIDTYRSYLETAEIPAGARANILYKIGSIYEEKLIDYETALATFISLKELYPQAGISSDAQRHIVQCLENLNRGSDAKRQMRSLADVNAKQEDTTPSGPVVAKIDERNITMSELDRELDKMPPQIRSQYEDPARKRQFLEQFVMSELLYDMGARKGYEKNPDVQKQLREMERQIIIQKVYGEEISAQIQLDESDYNLYFQAHQDEFKEPAAIQLAHIQLADENQAADILKRVEAGEKFGDLAKEFSTDASTKEKGGELGTLREGTSMIPQIGNEPEAAKTVSALEVGDATGPIRTAKGVHIFGVTGKTPERQKSLEEVRRQVEYALRRMKEEEQMQRLMKKMLDEQKVVIYSDRFPTPVPTPESNSVQQ